MNISICGAGTMGRGIALSAIQSGFPVVLFDKYENVLLSSKLYIEEQLTIAVQKAKLTEDKKHTALSLISYSSSIESLANSDIAIEAIIENKDAKSSFLREIEDACNESAIIATNTSSISVNSLAVCLRRPEKFVGLHFFNPAHIMKLVEIIKGARTSDDVVQTCVDFVRKLGKSPAVAKDVPGFIVNRVARNYYNESQRIVTEGAASIEQVDRLMKSAGFKMGPFELMDLIGVDVNLDVTKSIYAQYFNEPRFQPSLMQQQYVDAGLHGRKTGKGFYDYSTTQTDKK